ncbi:hypothetical protein [Tenacibaculum ovolyticum]|uniref:hypothetical protein n=1 Tax=Tenacibaculum ovolyticum TaxID=104270 RepID=UPI003BA85298
MKKPYLFLCSLFALISCQNFGQLTILADLPDSLEEVSGIQKIKGSDLLWMLNDSGNKPIIYGVDTKGKIIREVVVKAKNNDWEDITSDEEGNLYIADFGNNNNKRRDLRILKISYQDLLVKDEVTVQKIKFYYPSQKKFPPKKKRRFFDAESLLYKDGFLFIFTKSRVANNFGKTTLYKIPAIKGNHEAKFISTFETCTDFHCWVTAAAISPDKKKVALLNHQSVFVFTNFLEDDFLSGDVKEFPLGYVSQKEGIVFKDNKTLFITDERAHLKGGKLYEFYLN